MFRPAHARRRGAVVLLVVTLLATTAACGGGSDGDKPSKSHTVAKAERQLSGLRARIEKRGDGAFSQTVSDTTTGKVISNLSGRYSLDRKQIRATLTIANGIAKGKPAVAQLIETDGKAWVSTNQFKPAVRDCYLTSTPQLLLSGYGVELASQGKAVPIALRLLSSFDIGTSAGGGVMQGELKLQDVVPLLSGPMLTQLLQAQPKGSVPASIGIDGDDVTVSVAGYSLVQSLSSALKAPEAQLQSFRTLHFDTSLKPLKGSFTPVSAPPAGRQMTSKQLSANRCG